MDYFLTWLFNFIKENKEIIKRVLYVIAFLLAVSYFPEACRSCVRSSSSYSSDSEIDAYTTAKNIISKNLKAPSTAKFLSYDRQSITISGNIYTVNGYVDAQNSFGAMLRSYYTVTLRGSAYNWNIESIVFDGKELK